MSIRSLPKRRLAAVSLTAVAVAAGALAPSQSASAVDAGGYTQVNLVSDVPGLARITDFRVSNPWGIALGPETPVWINNNNTATSEVYAGANGKDPLALKLVVQTPAGPTGIAFNNTGAFAAQQNGVTVPTLFLFNGFDGYTSGWGPTAKPVTEAIPTRFDRFDGYLGMAVAKTPLGPRMYAASFANGVEVFGGKFQKVFASRKFMDPGVGKLVPYNVAVIGERVYVAYAMPDGSPGGAISVFRFNGDLVRTLSKDARLNAPWGMVMSPPHWGRFGNMLLVGNVNDGRINVLDPTTGAFRGQLRDRNGKVIANSGLWGLAFGNGKTGTPRDLLFAAGIDNYAHGLFGLIHPN
ncbi:MAG TPA: TIGR03118 family protein [Intrasporangium sp.]|uniref:TIGR03118 family protein n=1 Tax=Intrasporangium sp. TaxID=1925024 RepID=UPI002D79A4AC|nr:TIGR03118 family protein [Intrasporangium sp.]HET7397842.1 TIGR03118 family protein [Intrasporangium sp.]